MYQRFHPSHLSSCLPSNPGYIASSSHMTLSHEFYVIIPTHPSRLDSLIKPICRKAPRSLSLFIRSLLWSFITLLIDAETVCQVNFSPFQIISMVARLYLLDVFWHLSLHWNMQQMRNDYPAKLKVSPQCN